jgi:uncharacterized protein YqgV (UPF0045/DUF77 family)
MIAWFSIAPDDGSGSYSKQVAAAVRLIRESGFRYPLGAMGQRSRDLAAKCWRC